jgi:uncharacterized protein
MELAGSDDYPVKGGARVSSLASTIKEIRELLKSPFA